MIDNPRPRVEPVAPTDFGASAAPDRRCKTCACVCEVKNPANPLQSQYVCRRNPPGMLMMQNPITDKPEMGLTYTPTQPDLTCFDGWRPPDTAPGEHLYPVALCNHPMANGSYCHLEDGHTGIHLGTETA